MFLTFTCRSGLNFISDKSLHLKRLSYNMLCLISTSPSVNDMPCTKGWKILARDGPGKTTKSIQKELSLSCEEGADAVQHSVLMNKLQCCNSVSEQIKTFHSTISLTPEDVEKMKEFCKYLHEIFRPYFPDFKVNLFGSSLNGLGFKGCDVDVSLQTIFDGKDYLKDIKQVPTLESVIQGEASSDVVSHLPPRIMLRFVRRILRKHCSDIQEPMVFIKARCPLLRFYNTKFDLFCDFSCSNEASLRNTKLLRLICGVDKRFQILAQVIRYWGKYGGFVGDVDKFNSYAFSLLTVYFLQQTCPPVLPTVKRMIEKSEYLSHGDVNDDELFFKDLKNLEPSENSQPVEDLLREYFFYFLNFDFLNMMLPLTSSIMPTTEFKHNVDDISDNFEFSPVIIQDPFRLNFNVTAGANFKSCKNFVNALVETCKLYQDKTVWNPSSEMWGLCSIFHKSVSDYELQKEWLKNSYHTIKLPLRTEGTVVKEILQHGLLFDCSDLIVQNESEDVCVRLNCKVYNNTWQGRDWIYKGLPQSLTDPLKIENWISNEIMKSREENRRQVLCKFLCECIERRINNELEIVLSFNEYTPISTVLAVFLKEYIPNVYKKL